LVVVKSSHGRHEISTSCRLEMSDRLREPARSPGLQAHRRMRPARSAATRDTSNTSRAVGVAFNPNSPRAITDHFTASTTARSKFPVVALTDAGARHDGRDNDDILMFTTRNERLPLWAYTDRDVTATTIQSPMPRLAVLRGRTLTRRLLLRRTCRRRCSAHGSMLQ